MKKRIWILTLALALMLTGCGQKPSAPSEETPQQGQEEPVQEEGQQTPAEQAVYEDAQLSDQVHYPQLTEFQGELLLDYVNQSLARPAKELEGTGGVFGIHGDPLRRDVGQRAVYQDGDGGGRRGDQDLDRREPGRRHRHGGDHGQRLL